MIDVKSQVQLQIDGKPVPWDEVINQLQLFGKLLPFIQDIASQRLLLKEISSRSDLDIDPVELDQEINQFREKQDLVDEDRLKIWLQNERIDYQGLRTRMYLKLKIKKLKAIIAAPDIAEEFQARTRSLEQVVISYLLTASRDSAQELKDQLQQERITFQNLATNIGDQTGEANDVTVKAPAPPVRRSWLPKELQGILDTASVAELHGPMPIRDQWIVLQLEEVTPPSLDTRLERQLTEDLFNRWLSQRLGETNIKLQSNRTGATSQT
jgi:hypothetical protein